MFRILKRLSCVLLSLLAWNNALAFSTFGPLEGWQTTELDFGTRYYYGNDIELGGTKNFGDGSRLNVPVITYAYDYTFLSYFGEEGVKAVDAAMNAMNSLPAASKTKLSKYVTQGNQQINYTAQALELTDIKTTVMSLMIEHMGLIGESHVYDIRLRSPTPVTCEYGYTVVNWNYDPQTYNPTEYVNGVRVGFSIWDGCSNAVAVADAIETTVDLTSPAQYMFSAVATRYGQQVGGYYLGFTRDDVGGLAYLYSPSRIEAESLDTNSIATSSGGSPYQPVNPFATNGSGSNGFAGLLGGVNHVQYVKVAYDSLLGNTFNPIQYNYTIPFVTNSKLQTISVTRTVLQPDIIFSAGDLSVIPFSTTPDNYPNPYIRNFGFVSNNIVTTGVDAVVTSVISPQETITFNDVNSTFFNEYPSFMDSQQFILYPMLVWASFNGSTNAPTIFPNTTSIESLEQAVLTPTSSITTGLYNPVNPFSTNSTTTTTTGSGTSTY